MGTSIRLVGVCTLFALMLGGVALAADAPESSPRPQARPADPQAAHPNLPPVRPRARPEPAEVVGRMALATLPSARPKLRPLSRPESAQMRGFATRPQDVALLGPDLSSRPLVRPDSVLQNALFGRRKKRRGSVCGDIDIQGKEIGRVPGKLNGCGIKNGVQITSVSGVRLSRPSTMDCTTAKALNQWVKKGVVPAFRGRGKVAELRVAAGYACRTRNNQPGARISEHGRGKAIDISAFTMRDGEVVTVLKSWGKGGAGRALRKIRAAACGPFGTVLGPGSDRYHRTHFHMDTASYRSGPYCK